VSYGKQISYLWVSAQWRKSAGRAEPVIYGTLSYSVSDPEDSRHCV